MTRTALVTAGFVLATVLVLATSCEAAPDCKVSPGSPGCPSPRAVKSITPPKPDAAFKSAAKPQPKAEPQILQAQSRPQAAAKSNPAAGKPHRKRPPARMARRPKPGDSLVRNSRPYRYDSQPAVPSHGLHGRDSRPIFEARRAPFPSAGYQCDEDCRYRAWFREYNAWYQAYGRRYAEYQNSSRAMEASPPAMGNAGRPPIMPRRDEARIRSEQDRLDPWHGYDGHDGPQNGY